SDSKASVKNVIINGFELNTPTIKAQARNPRPENGDEHVKMKNKKYTLEWNAASGAESPDLYFGTDSAAVAQADHSSQLYKGNTVCPSFVTDTVNHWKTYYWLVEEVVKGKSTRVDIRYFRPASLAFPGAQGYGRFARGGKGGNNVYATNSKGS